MDDECDVITRRHSQQLPLDADLQPFRGQQGAVVLLGALLFVESAFTHIGHHLPVAVDSSGCHKWENGRKEFECRKCNATLKQCNICDSVKPHRMATLGL